LGEINEKIIKTIFLWFLIPKYGINGAVFASMFGLAIINIIPFFLVKKYYGFYTINFKGLKKA
jgi:O-antigen/teichoic acid export membrane protein